MEVDGAHHHNEDPRELEIFSDEQVEEVMESLEYFKSKIEQLQLYCEQLNQNKLSSDEAILEQKRKHQAEILKYQEEVNLLRSINIQLMTGKVASEEKRGNFSVSSLSCAIDSENTESRIQEMESKVRSLELTLAEKEKYVSVIEWQIMDMEATIAALQAERDQLILEIELRDPHEHMSHSSENVGAMARDGGIDEDHEYDGDIEVDSRRKTKVRTARRPRSDLLGEARGTESLSLKQMLSLSAEWSPKESSRTRKPPQRHFSDYVKRDSRARNGNISRGNTAHSLEDFDNISEGDSGLGLGRLTRTTNFCDILDADEYSNFHVADNRLSFTGDSVQGEQVNNDREPETESSRESLTKKWETFNSEATPGETLQKPITGNEPTVSGDTRTEVSFEKLNVFDERSVASSTSDFSSVFHSSQDMLQSSVDGVWTSSTAVSCSAIPISGRPDRNLSKKEISKSDSCISTSKSPPSDKDDLWNFTPDSILNVSTGEVLIPSVVETPPTPSVKKSRSFTSSLQIVLKDPKSKTKDSNDTEELKRTAKEETEDTKDNGDKTEGDSKIYENFDTIVHSQRSVELRSDSGESARVKRSGKSRSVIESTNQTQDQGSEVAALHQKSLSDPVKEDEKYGRHKLIEYQKWRKYGRRGKPPGDLRISDC